MVAPRHLGTSVERFDRNSRYRGLAVLSLSGKRPIWPSYVALLCDRLLLLRIYADGIPLVFPSGNDTWGNRVHPGRNLARQCRTTSGYVPPLASAPFVCRRDIRCSGGGRTS